MKVTQKVINGARVWQVKDEEGNVIAESSTWEQALRAADGTNADTPRTTDGDLDLTDKSGLSVNEDSALAQAGAQVKRIKNLIARLGYTESEIFGERTDTVELPAEALIAMRGNPALARVVERNLTVREPATLDDLAAAFTSLGEKVASDESIVRTLIAASRVPGLESRIDHLLSVIDDLGGSEYPEDDDEYDEDDPYSYLDDEEYEKSNGYTEDNDPFGY